MIFTIGHEANYLKAIAENGTIQKRGRYEDYPGGYAFESIEDAQRRIDEAYPDSEFAIFGLEADWEKDTYPDPDGWWHCLIPDADIVVLEG